MGLGFLFFLLLLFSAYVSNSDMKEDMKVGVNVAVIIIIIVIFVFTVIF